jgi:hypothetical protein
VFNGALPFMTKNPEETLFITTTSETGLRAAVNKDAKSVVITLDSDIQLTKPLIIPTNKNITLTSNNITNGFYKLIGANKEFTIIVKDYSVLWLDGVVVTHEKGAYGGGYERGVYGGGIFVDFNGTLIFYSGTICDNIIPNDHAITETYGGGVVNVGTFSMIGGEIFNNTGYTGGGVLNYGTFEMSGGKIFDNTASAGGAVYDYDRVDLSGGCSGGGVYNAFGNFSMSGGEISGNTAEFYGGGVFSINGDFSLFDGGVISGNTANAGGGVYNKYSVATMSGGVISDNVANIKGGGVLRDCY